MRKQLIAAMLGLSFVGVPMLTGCDKTVSEEKTVKTNPDTGTTSVDHKKVEKTDDGGTKKTEEHTVK